VTAYDLLQHIAVAANESESVSEAIYDCLHKICRHTNWPVGHVYHLINDGTDTLHSSDIWYTTGSKSFESFRAVSTATTFDKGIGLPGRVLASGQPAWIIDVTKDHNFPRAKLAKDIRVRAGFAFPVLIDSSVVAVLEFFSTDAIEPDPLLLNIMAYVGMQLGWVIKRKEAEKKLTEASNSR
jgi:GAF domain-containing protein